jgi:hypothetical protein
MAFEDSWNGDIIREPSGIVTVGAPLSEVIPTEIDEDDDAAHGHAVIAVAGAIVAGCACNKSPEAIADDAHDAMTEAYALYHHLKRHAQADADHAATHRHDGSAGPSPPSHQPRLDASVGKGGGGGGGGWHGGGGHGGGRGRGRWGGPWGWGGGGPSYYGGDTYIFGCGPGMVQLTDGTCLDARLLGIQPSVRVGAPLDAMSCLIDIEEDGLITLPDGTVTHADRLDWSGMAHLRGIHVGQDSTSEFPPSDTGSDLGGAASTTGTATSGNATADALNLQWAALAATVPNCLGANATLPTSYAPDLASTSWQDDYQGWQTFYAGIGSFGWEDITGDLSGWQSYANAWGALVKSKCPNIQLPENFPTATPGSWSLPLPDISTLTAPGVASALEWAVIATLVGVGIWVLWPVLAGTKAAVAAVA